MLYSIENQMQKRRGNPLNVTVYGDSILKGVVFENGKYRRNGIWERTLAEELGISIRNCSHFGSTIQKIMPTLRKHSGEPGPGEVVLLEFGGNDCDYDWAAIAENPDGRHHCKTPPELFAACYREAIALIRSSGRIPVALTLPPILSERYLNFICSRGISKEKIVSWLGDIGAISRRQKTYSELVTLVAREEQAELIDLRRAFPEEESDLERCICADGIHPSAVGQELIYRALRTYARPV